MSKPYSKTLLQTIRDARFKHGKLIGELIEIYGAKAVVDAFGVSTVAEMHAAKSEDELPELIDAE